MKIKYKYTFLFKVARYMAIQLHCTKRDEPEIWHIDWVYDTWDSNAGQMKSDIKLYALAKLEKDRPTKWM